MALGDVSLGQLASSNLHFLLDKLRGADGHLWHVYKDGKAQYPAFLDDHAHLIEALLSCYESTFETELLEQAARLTERVIADFGDPEGNLFFYTPSRQSDLILRKRELYDSATPSGNSTMVHNLFRLGLMLGKPGYSNRAEAMLKDMAPTLQKYPESFARWASGLLHLVFPTAEIAVLGPEATERAFDLAGEYLPNKVLMAAKEADERFPLLAGKGGGDETLIYVCHDYACRLPVRRKEEALKLVND
jgi:uncharacterized protein YyaL (SSP411 family)